MWHGGRRSAPPRGTYRAKNKVHNRHRTHELVLNTPGQGLGVIWSYNSDRRPCHKSGSDVFATRTKSLPCTAHKPSRSCPAPTPVCLSLGSYATPFSSLSHVRLSSVESNGRVFRSSSSSAPLPFAGKLLHFRDRKINLRSGSGWGREIKREYLAQGLSRNQHSCHVMPINIRKPWHRSPLCPRVLTQLRKKKSYFSRT